MKVFHVALGLLWLGAVATLFINTTLG
ncbi:MAG: hypothetical protein RIQ79_2572, partial [Verrucomicrobiota bacterium]